MVRPLLQLDIRDVLGDVTQSHWMPCTVSPEGLVEHHGHALHYSCDCQPRLVQTDQTPVFFHRRDV